jgi:peptide/nickel transport system ATP-binding protein
MPYTLGLLGSQPRLDLRAQRLNPISGVPPSAVDLPPGCPFGPRCPLAAARCVAEEPSLAPTTAGGHLSACHFSACLDGLAPGDLFRPVSRELDLPDPADLAEQAGLAEQPEASR